MSALSAFTRGMALYWGLLFAAVLSLAAIECAAAKPSPAEETRVATYGAELLECVAFAAAADAGIEASRACRQRVMRAYGRLDAGGAD